MRVAKWGNSLAVRLPQSVVELLKLKEGDSIEIHVVGRRSFEIANGPSPKELLARLRKYRAACQPISGSIGWKPISVAESQ